jgi:hypothetical protein
MSATSAPFGLRPAFHPSGLDRAQALAGGIVSGYASNIFKGQPVQYGTTANSGTLGTIIVAGATGAFVGAFSGVEFTDTTGRARVSNYWPASTAYTAGTCTAYFYNDQNIVYEIQSDATMAQTSIGGEYNFSNITAGSTTTGLSQCTISSSLAGSGAVGDMRIIGLTPAVDNAFGDAYTVVQVQVSRSQYVATINAI